MRRTTGIATLLGLLALTACSGSSSSTATQDPSTSPTSTSTALEPVGPLEGGWTTDLSRDAVVAYIHKNRWSRKAEQALLQPDMAGPDQTAFRVDFVGDYFRMSQVATDQQWQSGTFRLKDGRIYLDDEAPVGELTFAYHLDGDQITFDDPGDTSDPDNTSEFVDGSPLWAAGAVMWASTTWAHASTG